MIGGGTLGFVTGRVTAPVETEVVTKVIQVEVPVNKRPELDEVSYYDVPLSKSLQRYIYEICADEDVPVSLVMAMIEHESRFNHEAVSSTNDYGLMQINTINHERLEEQYRCDDMLNPYQNVFSGIKIIGSYLKKFNGDINKALMAYNMGEYGARKAWANGVNSIEYSSRIINLMKKY
jgi:soluble lytic murein transglycosylase-like protein